MMMINIAGLAVLSALSLNLLLQFALGTVGAADDTGHKTNTKSELPLIQFCILFISTLVLWVFFKYLLPGFLRGFSVYFLFFPLSAIVCMGLELFVERVLPRIFTKFKFTDLKKRFSAITAYDGLIPASLIIAFIVAETFTDTLVISLSFALGNLAAMLTLNEINRRSALEWVPKYLRGTPLILISMGFLSLISAFAAGILFRILELF
jgi:Na+-translocating ferredoxin:NAD+ oxidoreductase RnfA subunit